MTGVVEVTAKASKDWYSAGAFRFRHNEVLWIYLHYEELSQGYWPRKITGYIDNQYINTRGRRVGAYFEDAAGIMAEFHSRLDECGRDGVICKCYKCYGWPLSELSTIAKLNQEQLDIIVNRVTAYIAGRRKVRTYREFCAHW